MRGRGRGRRGVIQLGIQRERLNCRGEVNRGSVEVTGFIERKVMPLVQFGTLRNLK